MKRLPGGLQGAEDRSSSEQASKTVYEYLHPKKTRGNRVVFARLKNLRDGINLAYARFDLRLQNVFEFHGRRRALPQSTDAETEAPQRITSRLNAKFGKSRQ